MDFSVALTLVQTLLQLLDSSTPLRREIESVWGYKKQLKKLEKTISTIQNVLLDAEQLQLQLTHTQQGILKRLNEVLYEVDDLLDEVATLVQRKKFMSGNNVDKEVNIFLSRYNQLKYAFTKSREIRKIRESLDDIAKDHSLFGSIVPQQAGGGRTSQIINNPRETGSLLNEDDVIIGRDDDKRVVINMLVGPPVEERVCCVSIVGIGGLGKTTLAQLVYNDKRITREFELKMWVCVSNDFDVKTLLTEILAAATKKPKEDLSMDRLQTRIQEELDGKKYLLVLDDLWDDVTSKWDKLNTPLINGGRRGSRILISTRSQAVADFVGGQKHELKGLSETESWKLFERMTLLSRQEMEALNGEKILKKCANVPLAIRVIGSYLRGQGQGKWTHMGNIDLANDESIEDIVSLLMISYYDLPFQLKRCFSYCAVFPKDYEIIKEDLIYLWMAQGFIQTKGRSLEDVGEEYFMNLLHRCFFQDINCGDDGEIISCKMHDLIHDVAKSIVGTEMMLVQNDTSNLNAEVYHVFSESKNAITFLAQMKRMRTLLRKPSQGTYYSFVNDIKIPRVESLRVLSLPNNDIVKVPKMIGELIHLRYLDLSRNSITLLPPSITNLFNLQTLKLRCSSLVKLPDDLGKLVNLRVLDLYNCIGLRNMPLGMRRLTFLHKLTYFALGNPKYDSTKALEDLKCLKSLTGTLVFSIHYDWTCDVAEVREGGYLSELEQLKEIVITFRRNAEINSAQALLNGLQPNHNLRKVCLSGCPRVRLPSWWGRGVLSKNPKSYLPELVEIHLYECSVLELFPSMCQLPKLRVLRLRHLYNIEYIESSNNGDVDSTDLTSSPPGEAYEESVFFPSLQILQLESLANLKGWGLLHSNTYVFPQLKSLDICYCKQLASLPLCPQVSSFQICDFESLSFQKSLTCNRQKTPENYRVDINSVNVGYIINSLPTNFTEHLSHLDISNWNVIKRLKPVELSELFQSGRVSSLLSLKIFRCEKLRSLSELEEMWEHLTALETLIFEDNATLKLEWEDDGDCCSDSGEHKGVEGEIREEDDCDSISAFDKPWTFFTPTLRSLTLNSLPMLVKLPRGMHCLTSLNSLEISICNNLEEIPTWIGCFPSLHFLHIYRCRKLKSVPQEMCQLTSLKRLSLKHTSREMEIRCQEPYGADWPKIQHIPFIEVV